MPRAEDSSCAIVELLSTSAKIVGSTNQPLSRPALAAAGDQPRAVAEAGLPDGLLHVLPGGVDAGEALIADPLVRIISFTGLTAAGRGWRTRPRHLEAGWARGGCLGRPAPRPDLHDDGQAPGTRGRVRDYVAAMADKASHLPVGDPATGQVALGPIIDERQRDRVHALVTASTGAGARLAAGGTYEGLFYKPTVLADVTQETPAYANEVFGPVAPVLRFGTVDEVAAIAANSEYGLSLGILTRDVMRGLDLARRITSGIVHINDQTVDDEPTVPFGGVLDSGTGTRFGGTANLEAFTETRWVTMQGDITPYPF